MIVITVSVECVSCGSSFNREVKRGRPTTKCPGCREIGHAVTQFALSQRKEEVTSEGVTMVQNSEPCRDCGQVFMRPKKRGKPPVRCEGCKGKADAVKADEVRTSDAELEDLFQGDKNLLQGTPGERPKGNEAQCPTRCGRIFTSNTSCDSHKKWLPNGSYTCLDPAELGMEPRTRRGIPVWTRSTPVTG